MVHNEIRENIARLRGRIEAAAQRAGRDPAEITLIAVSKTKPVEMIYEAYRSGVAAFGENYAQELCEKYNELNESGLKDVEWHMIGHIQTNKVRQIIGKTKLIHSLDSLRLAAEIQRFAEKTGETVNTLIEVNVAREYTKQGFYPEETRNAVEAVAAHKNVKVLGLMTSAPLTDDPESNRVYFRRLRELYIDIKENCIHNYDMCFLSMGMSGDFEVAIEEGATMLRIGTAIFGRR